MSRKVKRYKTIPLRRELRDKLRELKDMVGARTWDEFFAKLLDKYRKCIESNIVDKEKCSERGGISE